MFYDSASRTNLPSLYLCRAENVLGRVPMMPCFVAGNSTPTLPHQFGDRDGAVADTSAGRGNGSRLYELNLWMWRYGRGQPLHVTVAEAEQRRKERTSDARRPGQQRHWSGAGRSVSQPMMTVLMIERHMLQMMLYDMLCNLLYNHWGMLYTTNGVI